jgi:hypothetical protein
LADAPALASPSFLDIQTPRWYLYDQKLRAEFDMTGTNFKTNLPEFMGWKTAVFNDMFVIADLQLRYRQDGNWEWKQ